MYRNFPKHGRKRPYTGKIRSFTSVNAPYTISVFRRISPYTITVKYDRNTVTCNTAKNGCIQSVYGMYTVVSKIRYTTIFTNALSTCRGFLITGNIGEQPFFYLAHRSKIYEPPSFTPSST
jgi:uncharacterized protein YmfQ (DUF2313 family)